jgi:hypothetical protein
MAVATRNRLSSRARYGAGMWGDRFAARCWRFHAILRTMAPPTSSTWPIANNGACNRARSASPSGPATSNPSPSSRSTPPTKAAVPAAIAIPLPLTVRAATLPGRADSAIGNASGGLCGLIEFLQAGSFAGVVEWFRSAVEDGRRASCRGARSGKIEPVREGRSHPISPFWPHFFRPPGPGIVYRIAPSRRMRRRTPALVAGGRRDLEPVTSDPGGS